jgi:hypothetical protein
MALAHALSTYPYFQAWYTNAVDPLVAEEAIDAATVAIERAIGQVAFVQRTITAERHRGGDGDGLREKRGGATRIYLNWAPIVSVSAIADDQDTPSTVAATEYEVEPTHLEHHTVWPAPFYRWKITYVAGHFASVTAVTDDVRTACHRMAAHILKAPQGPILSETKGDASTSYDVATGILPADVMQLVAPYRRVGLA